MNGEWQKVVAALNRDGLTNRGHVFALAHYLTNLPASSLIPVLSSPPIFSPHPAKGAPDFLQLRSKAASDSKKHATLVLYKPCHQVEGKQLGHLAHMCPAVSVLCSLCQQLRLPY